MENTGCALSTGKYGNISRPLERQFVLIYLEAWGSTQPYTAFSTQMWFFFVCFWWNTHDTKFSYAVSCQVFLVGSWMELVFFVLQSKRQLGMGLYCFGWHCHNSLGPLVNLWTTGTVGQQFVLSVSPLFFKFLSVMSSVSLSMLL
jgi:hypothetical protein